MSQIFDTALQSGCFVAENSSDQQLPAHSWLAQFSLLRIEGPDSERFLQGQLTCDVAKLPADQWSLGACCTAKGRMVANFIIARDQADGYWLRLPTAQVDALIQHLKKYAVFFKAQLTDLSASHKIVALIPAQQPAAEQLDSEAIISQRSLSWSEQGAELSYHDGRKEYWLINDNAEQKLTSEALCDSKHWQLFDINQATIWVDTNTREHWIPQNIDWQLQGGVSFSKGCYTGQEIVARLQYLGKAKKALYRISTQESQPLAILSELKTAEGRSIGELCSWSDNQGLALLTITEGLEQVLLVTESSEIPLSIEKLSYTQEQENTTDA